MTRKLRLILVLLPVAVVIAPLTGCGWLSKTFTGGGKVAPAEPTPEQRRAAYVEKNPDLDPAVRDAIVQGRLVQGMAEADVRASLGRPIEEKVMLPASPEQGEFSWVFEQIAFGTKTSYEAAGPRSERILTGVRDTRVRFWEGKVVGVDDLGYATRDELADRCQRGAGEACDRLHHLDALAASGPVPAGPG